MHHLLPSRSPDFAGVATHLEVEVCSGRLAAGGVECLSRSPVSCVGLDVRRSTVTRWNLLEEWIFPAYIMMMMMMMMASAQRWTGCVCDLDGSAQLWPAWPLTKTWPWPLAWPLTLTFSVTSDQRPRYWRYPGDPGTAWTTKKQAHFLRLTRDDCRTCRDNSCLITVHTQNTTYNNELYETQHILSRPSPDV